ncbi:hypothetical protein GBF38_006456, partial [Nibea albiflora]
MCPAAGSGGEDVALQSQSGTGVMWLLLPGDGACFRVGPGLSALR